MRESERERLCTFYSLDSITFSESSMAELRSAYSDPVNKALNFNLDGVSHFFWVQVTGRCLRGITPLKEICTLNAGDYVALQYIAYASSSQMDF